MDVGGFQEKCLSVCKVGLGIALVPAALAALAALSKIIFVNIIANVIVGALSGGTMWATVTGFSLVQLPLVVWQGVLVLGAVGGGVAVLALLAIAASAIYSRCAAKNATNE